MKTENAGLKTEIDLKPAFSLFYTNRTLVFSFYLCIYLSVVPL